MCAITAAQLIDTALSHGWTVTRPTDMTWTATRDGAHVIVVDSRHGFWRAHADGVPGLEGYGKCLFTRSAVDDVLRGLRQARRVPRSP